MVGMLAKVLQAAIVVFWLVLAFLLVLGAFVLFERALPFPRVDTDREIAFGLALCYLTIRWLEIVLGWERGRGS